MILYQRLQQVLVELIQNQEGHEAGTRHRSKDTKSTQSLTLADPMVSKVNREDKKDQGKQGDEKVSSEGNRKDKEIEGQGRQKGQNQGGQASPPAPPPIFQDLDQEIADFKTMMQDINALKPASDTLTSLLEQTQAKCLEGTEEGDMSVEGLRYQKSILLRELMECKSVIEKLEKDVSTLRDEVGKSENEKLTLKDELEMSKKESSTLREELAKAKLVITELEFRNDSLTKLSTNAEQIIGKLQSNLTVANTTIKTSSATEESLLSEKDKLTSEMKKLQMTNHATEEKLSKMEADLNEAVGYIAKLESDKELLQTRLQGTNLQQQTFSGVRRRDVVIQKELDSGGWAQLVLEYMVVSRLLLSSLTEPSYTRKLLNV